MNRPRWALWLDRLVVPSSRWIGRFFPRPTEAQLHALSERRGALNPPQKPPSLAAEDHIQMGRKALEQSAFGESLHHFGQALELHPEARWAWHGRGDALQLSGEPALAQKAYEKAIALDPSCGLHHAGRANALAALARSDEAEKAWTEALRLDPTLTWMRQD